VGTECAAPRSFACGRRAAAAVEGSWRGSAVGNCALFSLREGDLVRAAQRQPIRLGGFASASAANLAAQSASTAAKSRADDDACAFQIPARICWPNTDKAHLALRLPTDRSRDIPYAAWAQPARRWAALPARDEARPGLCGTHRAGGGPADCEPQLINFSNLPRGLRDYHLVIGNSGRRRVRPCRSQPRRR
jgi:hypothetical protein